MLRFPRVFRAIFLVDQKTVLPVSEWKLQVDLTVKQVHSGWTYFDCYPILPVLETCRVNTFKWLTVTSAFYLTLFSYTDELNKMWNWRVTMIISIQCLIIISNGTFPKKLKCMYANGYIMNIGDKRHYWILLNVKECLNLPERRKSKIILNSLFPRSHNTLHLGGVS